MESEFFVMFNIDKIKTFTYTSRNINFVASWRRHKYLISYMSYKRNTWLLSICSFRIERRYMSYISDGEPIPSLRQLTWFIFIFMSNFLAKITRMFIKIKLFINCFFITFFLIMKFKIHILVLTRTEQNLIFNKIMPVANLIFTSWSV